MNPSIVLATLSSLQKIWEAESQQKFQEWIMNTLQSLVHQINSINYDQMQEVSNILTKFEWIQYSILLSIIIVVSIFAYLYFLLLRRIRILEAKNK